jgi:uncharacterized protein
VKPRLSGHDARSAPIPAAAGIGLRLPHHEWVIANRPRVGWLEVHPENYMTSGTQLGELDRIARDYPLSLHAVGLSLGSVRPCDPDHLRHLAALARRYEAALLSDHLSWSAIDAIHLPDLLPLPYTEEALDVVIRNVEHAQHTLQRTLLLENPSRYLALPYSTLSEAQFLAEIVRRTGCGVLLDINNLYVSATNAEVAPEAHLQEFLELIPECRIGEIHLAGHSIQHLENGRSLRIDDHGSEVCPEVWQLYATAIRTLGPRPTLIEWDTRLPTFERLQQEARAVQSILDETLSGWGRVAAR